MIKILMLDLGETLVHGDTVFPHAVEALEVLSEFKTSSGEPVSLCLVSDYTMPAPPPNETKIKKLFKEYVAILNKFGLTKFFEPVERHVTLSTNAGVYKPERRIFELAIERLGVQAGIGDCVFVTENSDHILACRKLGMKTLMFDPSAGASADFSDWAQAPLIIGKLIGDENLSNKEVDSNLDSAWRLYLAAEHGLELTAMDKKSTKTRLKGTAKKTHPVRVSQPDGSEKSVHAALPVEVDAELDEKGRVRSVESGQPNPEEISDAQYYLKTLEEHKRIAHHDGPLKPGETHREETDEQGRTQTKRKRFSAI
jgi:hypothetical protein